MLRNVDMRVSTTGCLYIDLHNLQLPLERAYEGLSFILQRVKANMTDVQARALCIAQVIKAGERLPFVMTCMVFFNRLHPCTPTSKWEGPPLEHLFMDIMSDWWLNEAKGGVGIPDLIDYTLNFQKNS